MCLGGHLALRNVFEPEVVAAVCLFPTDVHSGTLGSKGDDTLARLTANHAVGSEVTFVFGRQDDHVPPAGRAQIYEACVKSETDYQVLPLPPLRMCLS